MVAEQILHIQRFLQESVLRVLEPVRNDLETQLNTSKKVRV